MVARRPGLGYVLARSMALSIVLSPAIVLGQALGIYLGTRTCPERAAGIGLLGGALWAAALWAASLGSVVVGGTTVELGPLALLAPGVGLGALAGGLLAVSSARPRSAGWLLLVAGLALTAYQFQPVMALVEGLKPAEKRTAAVNQACSENLRQLYSAAMLYADSWDGMLPPADRWLAAIKEYVPKDEWTRCPDVPEGSGYAMNSELSGKSVASVADKAGTPLFYDSAATTPNAHDPVSSLPDPPRHRGANNIVYLDGHTDTKQGR